MAYRRSSDGMAYEPNGLDEINRRLLEELQTDGRVAFAALGGRVALSAPAVAERVGPPEREGGITAYRAAVPPKSCVVPLGPQPRLLPYARETRSIPGLADKTP